MNVYWVVVVWSAGDIFTGRFRVRFFFFISFVVTFGLLLLSGSSEGRVRVVLRLSLVSWGFFFEFRGFEAGVFCVF